VTESSRGPAYVLKKHLEGLLPKNRTGDAAIGAIATDTGKGVGVGAGAVAGTMRGGMQQRQANAAAEKQAAAQTAAKQQKKEEELKTGHAEGSDTFQRAFEACMDTRACRSPNQRLPELTPAAWVS
jgi:hypothetical protein